MIIWSAILHLGFCADSWLMNAWTLYWTPYVVLFFHLKQRSFLAPWTNFICEVCHYMREFVSYFSRWPSQPWSVYARCPWYRTCGITSMTCACVVNYKVGNGLLDSLYLKASLLDCLYLDGGKNGTVISIQRRQRWGILGYILVKTTSSIDLTFITYD
jgi:hypothetical protein